jgi:DNA-binding response OmpR family regulator
MRLIRDLIVEDEPIAASYLKKIVEKSDGVRVLATASTAQEAFSVLAAQTIDVIFMDVVIRGDRNGDELAVDIRRLYPEILILFLTAYSNDEIVNLAAHAHAFAFLVKPYRPEEIRATLSLARAALKERQEKAVLPLIDGYWYDFEVQRLLHVKAGEVPLSALENQLIAFLAENQMMTISSEALTEMFEITDDALRALIYRIRKETSKDLIQSVKRFGYKLSRK